MGISGIIKQEFKLRLLEEGMLRIQKCVGMLNEEEIWYVANENTNSIGNLILHLEGNVRQYIITGIGNGKDERVRDSEFLLESRIDTRQLLLNINATIQKSIEIVDGLEEEMLCMLKHVQGFKLPQLSIIIHVIEHFSYHVGQITQMTKLLKNKPTRYYEGKDLNINSN